LIVTFIIIFSSININMLAIFVAQNVPLRQGSSESFSSSGVTSKEQQHQHDNNMINFRKRRGIRIASVSYKLAVLAVLLASTTCFWMGTLVSQTYPASIHLASQRNALLEGGANHTSPMTPSSSANLQSSHYYYQQLQHQPQKKPRLPLEGWLQPEETSRGAVSSPTPATVDEHHHCASPSLSSLLYEEDEEHEEAREEAARLQHFQELVVHPAMLTMKEKHDAQRIAIVLDEEELLPGLIEQLLLYPSVQQIYVVEDTPQDCQDTWNDLFSSSSDVSVECVATSNLPTSFQIDIVLMLENCDVLDEDDDDEKEETDDEDDMEESFRFWFDRLSSKSGSLVTCLGNNMPLGHPLATSLHTERMEIIEALDDAKFQKIVEYDIRLPDSRYARSIAVAMKDGVSKAQWRLNEAHFARRMQKRLVDPSSLQWFDSATMLSLRYPSKHSAVRFCGPNGNYLDDGDDELDEICDKDGHGYDPFTANIPVTDLFLEKSQAGVHAGRGVFTKVDIPADTYIGLETTIHSVMYEWTTTELHGDMMDFVPEYANSKGRIIFVFAEAYGYSQEPWNMQQESVMSNVLTFLNHGCNGTSNVGDFAFADMTEFTIDLESGVIPEVYRTKIEVPYAPHFDRDQVKQETMSRAFRPIRAGEELYDNYMSFGGDTYFREMVEMLRQECSGSSGMVEQYQKNQKIAEDTGSSHNNNSWGFRHAHDEL
jgi:SET domain